MGSHFRWAVQGASSPLQQEAHILPDELSSAQSSAFHQRVLAREICGRPFPSTRVASGMRKGFRMAQRSPRQQINVPPGWWLRAEPRHAGTRK